MRMLALVLVFICSGALGQTRSLTIAYSEEVKPYAYIEGDQLTGIDIEILRQLLARSNMTVNFVYIPWGRALRSSQSGLIDGVVSIFCDHSPEGLIITNEVSYTSNISVLALKSNGFTPSDLHKNKPVRRINVVRRSFYASKLKDFPNLSAVYLPEITSQVNQLLQGHVDFSLSEEAWFLNTAEEKGSGDKVAVVQVIDVGKVCIGFSEKSFVNGDSFIKRVNESLKQMKQDGVVQKILSRFSYSSAADLQQHKAPHKPTSP